MIACLKALVWVALTLLALVVIISLILWLTGYLPNFRWYRKWKGGRWELWWNQQTYLPTWYHNHTGRPYACMGTPVVEDYTSQGQRGQCTSTVSAVKEPSCPFTGKMQRAKN